MSPSRGRRIEALSRSLRSLLLLLFLAAGCSGARRGPLHFARHLPEGGGQLERHEVQLEGGNVEAPPPPLEMWALTLNKGKMTDSKLSSVMTSLADDAARAGVFLVIVGMQESGTSEVPRVPDEWTLYRTRLQLRGGFSLQTLILARGLKVRTHRVDEQKLIALDFLNGARVVTDKAAAGCKRGQPGAKGCWATALYHECKVSFPLCFKGTLVTSLEIVPRTDGPWSQSLSPRASPRWRTGSGESKWSARLVVANSHFGIVKDPLHEQMLVRAGELAEATALVRVITGVYTVPSVMLGDWNFRMSPLGELRDLMVAAGSSIPTDLVYTGPVILPDAKEQVLRVAMMINETIPEGRDMYLYDEVLIARALVEAQVDPLPAALHSFRELLEEAGMEEEVGHALTCRYRELRGADEKPMSPVAYETVSEVPLGALPRTLLESGAPWRAFEDAGHSLKVNTETGVVTRPPSSCDRIFWSPGNFLNDTGDPGLEKLLAPMGPFVPHSEAARNILLETDHLPIVAKLRLHFQDMAAAMDMRRAQIHALVPPRVRDMMCCCHLNGGEGAPAVQQKSYYAAGQSVLSSITSLPGMIRGESLRRTEEPEQRDVEPFSCRWQQKYSVRLGSGCNFLGQLTPNARHHIYGLLTDRGVPDGILVEDTEDPQRTCEDLTGPVVEVANSNPTTMHRLRGWKFVKTENPDRIAPENAT